MEQRLNPADFGKDVPWERREEIVRRLIKPSRHGDKKVKSSGLGKYRFKSSLHYFLTV
jgi:hypothetical protein